MNKTGQKHETFTARVQLADGTEREIYNCILYRDKVGVVRHLGVGKLNYSEDGDEYYDDYKAYIRPFLNKDLLAENGLTQESADKLINKDPNNAIYDERIYNSMFVLGENVGGKICINLTAEREKERRKKEEEIERTILQKRIPISFCWGIFGLRIETFLPESLWKLIEKEATYHKGDADDMEFAEDMDYFDATSDSIRGWYYTKKAIDILSNAGFPILYRNQPISSSEEMKLIDDKCDAARNKYYADQMAIENEKTAIRALLSELSQTGTYIDRSEAESIAKIEQLHYKDLHITGPTIYGTGEWLHNTPDALYYVINNGADGDDWLRNNYPTSGAGAICVKIVKPNAKVDDLLKRAEPFK